jgi:hypothetical protein
MSFPLDNISVYIDCTHNRPDPDYLDKLIDAGIKVQLLIRTDSNVNVDLELGYDLPLYEWDNSESLASSLGQLLADEDAIWTILLQGAEQVAIDELEQQLSDLPDEIRFLEAILHTTPSEVAPTQHRFEIRAVKTGADLPFSSLISGKLRYEITAEQPARVHPESLNIRRSDPISQQIKWPDWENFDPQEWQGTDLLWLGYYALEKQEIRLSESIFKTLKQKFTLPFRDRASLLNGLAQVSFEKQQWDQARDLLQKSLELQEQQQLPHLIRFNITSKQMRWEEAYQNLYSYLQVLAEGSRINHDVVMPLDQTHQLLADTAYQGGQHERAFVHYQEVFRIRRELDKESDPNVLERLLLYSIELDEKEKAIMYFRTLYEDELTSELSDKQWQIIDRRIQLFAGNEWFDFVVQQYQQLFEHNSKRPAALRRLVAALIKNGQIEQAQSLIHKHKTVIS